METLQEVRDALEYLAANSKVADPEHFGMIETAARILKDTQRLETYMKHQVGSEGAGNAEEEAADEKEQARRRVIGFLEQKGQQGVTHEPASEDEESFIGKAQRKLTGAILVDDNDDVEVVSEVLVRALGLKSGDIVEYDGLRYYMVEKAQETVDDGILELQRCVVESMEKNGNHLFVVKETVEGDSLKGRIGGRPYLIISDKDIERLFIEEGDIVDVTIYINSGGMVCRVRWKH